MCAAHPKNISSVNSIIHLWYHENMRVYHDRLVNKEDRDMLVAECTKLANTFHDVEKGKPAEVKEPAEGAGAGA